jgi:FtsH-binding integral membrane protein
MNCNNYVGKTFAHVGGLIGLTALGTQIGAIDPALEFLEKKGSVAKILFVVGFIGLFILFLGMKPGPFKYIAAVLISVLLGMLTRKEVQKLQMKDTLDNVLVYTAAISFSVVALAFLDKSNRFMSFFPILIAGLFGILAVSVIYALMGKGQPTWLSMVGAALFTLFIGADTQLIREHAKTCRIGRVDYIDESFGLYLDILNLFSNLADLS